MVAANFAKWGTEIDRVRGWIKEMEAGERFFGVNDKICQREIAGHSVSSF